MIPNDARGQVLFVLALFGLGAIMGAIVFAWARGRRPLVPVPVGHRRNLGVALAGFAVWGSVAIAMEVFEATTAVDVAVGVVVATAGAWAVLTWAWVPIRQSDVDGRLKEWQEE